MAKGILYIESRPVSDDRVDEYNRWYDETHLPEIVALPGFVAARRFKPADGDGPYVAIYEVEADDLSTVTATLGEAMASGALHLSDALALDSPPTVRLLETTTEHAPTSANA